MHEQGSHWRHGVRKKNTEEEEDAFFLLLQPRCVLAVELADHRAVVSQWALLLLSFLLFRRVFVYPAPARDQGHCVTQLRKGKRREEEKNKKKVAGCHGGVAMETG